MIKALSQPAAVLILAVAIVAISCISIGVDQRKVGDFSFLADRLEKEKVAFDQPAEASEYYLLKRSPDGQSPIPIKRYLDAIDHMKRMPQYSTAMRAALPSLR